MTMLILMHGYPEPDLNAWFKNNEQQLHSHVNLGLAMDTTDGLFVPVLSQVDTLPPQKIREQVNYFKKVVEERTVKPSELQGATFTLSNFGMFAGRYANPIIVPPQVGILATGKIRDVVLAINGEPKVQRIMPLSLTFDHRAATGGEATRFLAAIMADLLLAE
jgi:2-oxoisovalerate dehydrogenase E2 component (dihydrolipoyl transacylase)